MQHSEPLRVALAANATDTSFAALVSTLTEPTGAGVLTLAGNTSRPKKLHISFFGAGADDSTFDARIIGWDRVEKPGADLWIPRILCSLTLTLSTQVGVTGARVIATDRFADTMVVHATVAPQSTFTDVVSAAAASRGVVEIFSPANNVIAWAKVPINGAEKIQVVFDMTGATNGNAVYRWIED
jgi:hypothetical protein